MAKKNSHRSPVLSNSRHVVVRTTIIALFLGMASLMNGGAPTHAESEPLTAGYNGGFFIRAEDNAFLLKIGGEAQFRYISNSIDRFHGDEDDDAVGMQIRRARLSFSGHAFSPSLTYKFLLSGSRSSNSVSLELAYLTYAFSNRLALSFGQMTVPFLKEEMNSSFRQLAAERSYANDYFSVDYSQGLSLSVDYPRFRGYLTYHDGSYGDDTDFADDITEVGLTVRLETVVAGEWKHLNDYQAWPETPFVLALGAAIDKEWADTGAAPNAPDILKYSGDLTIKAGPFGLFAAYYGQTFEDNAPAIEQSIARHLDCSTQWGAIAQTSIFLVPGKFEPFARYEWIDFDGVYYRLKNGDIQNGSGEISGDQYSFLTIGANYYLKKHNVKMTLDAMRTDDHVPVSNTAAGILGSNGVDQTVVRIQFQVRF